MTDLPESIVPYLVSYSGVFNTTIRAFILRATAAGYRETLFAALKRLERLLHIYPQFGEPLFDLKQEPGQIYHATVSPLVVRYAVFEERRLVVVLAPPKLLPNAGF